MINFQVSQLIDYMKNITSKDFILNKIQVEGEISNYTKHSNGNLYFSIKDDISKIDCILFSEYLKNVDTTFKAGDYITVQGSVNIREDSGVLYINTKKIEQYGLGKLYENFEKLRKELETQGYFKKENKLSLPLYPTKVGVITSPTGAAIRDIIKVLNDRNRFIDLFLYPTTVQGPFAVQSMITGLRYFEDKDLDVIIIGRGGGAYEDLDAFNSKELALEIFNHPTPIVSAVGHAVDTVISDYISDAYAATPTDAANLVFFDMDLYLNNVINKTDRIYNRINTYMETESNKLNFNKSRIQVLSIEKSINNELELIKHKINNLGNELEHKVSLSYEKLNNLKLSISSSNIINKTHNESANLESIYNNLTKSMEDKINKQTNRLLELKNKLNRHDIDRLLKSGFAMLLDSNDNIIKSSDNLKVGDLINLLISNSKLKVKIIERDDE